MAGSGGGGAAARAGGGGGPPGPRIIMGAAEYMAIGGGGGGGRGTWIDNFHGERVGRPIPNVGDAVSSVNGTSDQSSPVLCLMTALYTMVTGFSLACVSTRMSYAASQLARLTAMGV